MILVEVPQTGLNQRLAESLHNRMAADQFLVSGRAAFWRLVGAELVAFGAGAAIGVGLYG